MSTRTIETTVPEDEAIAYAHQQSQKPIGVGGAPPPAETEAAFFQRKTHMLTIRPMLEVHQTVLSAALVQSFASVPPENQDAARAAIEAVIVEQGGTVTVLEVPYLWSSNTAPPPRNNSVELDVSDANVAALSKVTVHYLDRNGVDRMVSLMAVPANALIKLVSGDNPDHWVSVIATAAPIQRQGPDGFVEFPARFNQQSGGPFAPLDTRPISVQIY